MDYIVKYLKEHGITDTAQIHAVANLMMDAVYDSNVRNAAEEIAVMDQEKIEHIVQQVLGGR
jgi:hypothetical protein